METQADEERYQTKLDPKIKGRFWFTNRSFVSPLANI